jgi:hypothetical protein
MATVAKPKPDNKHSATIKTLASCRQLEFGEPRAPVEWAVGIITAQKRLRRAVMKASSGRMESSELIGAAHNPLHIALVAGSTSKRLAAMQSLPFDQAVPLPRHHGEQDSAPREFPGGEIPTLTSRRRSLLKLRWQETSVETVSDVHCQFVTFGVGLHRAMLPATRNRLCLSKGGVT